LIKLNKVLLVTIFTNYALLVSILKKSNLIIAIFTNKLNLYLICAKEYLSKIPLLIWHKLSKANFVLNALLRLLIIDNPELEAIKSLTKEGELDALFAYNTFTNKTAYNKCIISLINIIPLRLLLLILRSILKRNLFKDIN
jgi:hypothetical protein